MAAQLAIIVIFSSFHFKLFGNHPFFSFVFGMKERKKMMMDRMSDQHASILTSSKKWANPGLFLFIFSFQAKILQKKLQPSTGFELVS